MVALKLLAWQLFASGQLHYEERVATASASKHLIVHSSTKMAPDTSLEPFVNVSAAAMSLPVIPTSPDTLRDTNLEEDLIDPEAKLILSDFTQSSSA